MANYCIPRPNARFHARQDNFVAYVNGHLPDLALAAGVMAGEIWVKVGDPPPAPHPSRLAAPENAKLRTKKRGQDQVAVPI